MLATLNQLSATNSFTNAMSKIQIKKGDDYEMWVQWLKDEICVKAQQPKFSEQIPQNGIKVQGSSSLAQLLIPNK